MMKRILQVVGRMNRGGVETSLMHVLRHIDRQNFQMDFLYHTAEECAYDDEIRKLGSRIIPCLSPSRPLIYARNLEKILYEHGPYDIIHSRVHHFSGYALRVANRVGIPMRIAHSHNDISSLKRDAGLLRKMYYGLTEKWVDQYATHGLAVSEKAASSLFGDDWRRDKRYRILYQGIDFEPFAVPVDRDALRNELGIPQDALVIGHIGRFVAAKNHSFLVDIASEVLKRQPKACFLLIGAGPLRSVIEKQVCDLGLSGHFTFAGVRTDVPRVLKGAVDILVLPSLHEGLPLTILEAQAAGRKSIISDTITTETSVVRALVEYVPLSSSPAEWAEVILDACGSKSTSQTEALEALRNSPFDVKHHIKALTEIYSS